jgi:hypothetical protein
MVLPFFFTAELIVLHSGVEEAKNPNGEKSSA